MISTGTDIKPLECLLFMRTVNSRVYYEQMKGRGTRVISPTDLETVSPDAKYKTHFVIVDAVGVCERDKTDSRPLERKRHVSFDRLLHSIATGIRDVDSITSLAGRLARLDRSLDPTDREAITALTNGQSIPDTINALFNSVDPDKQRQRAQEQFRTDTPTDEQLQQVAQELMDAACNIFDSTVLRNTLVEFHQRNEQILDHISKDTVTEVGFDTEAKERAQNVVNTFKQFIEENKAELTALQIIYNKPYGQRHLTHQSIKELAEAIEMPPYRLTTEQLWSAYEQLEQSKVKGAGPQNLLTNIISLIRFAIGESKQLEPFMETVNHRFDNWIAEQEAQGKQFTPEQMMWLQLIRDRIATELSIEIDDFEYAPFYEKGGPMKVEQLFGDQLNSLLETLTERLAA
jgi:type I restriction enzyme R subunit